jgi:hypothetical protein
MGDTKLAFEFVRLLRDKFEDDFGVAIIDIPRS